MNALTIPSRRALVAAPLAFAATAAESAAQCRLGARPSVSICADRCGDLWSTFECQADVLFPGPRSAGTSILIGAVLGGAIAWASGDIDVLTGVLIGGAVGGVVWSVSRYVDYRLSRAGGQVGRAFEETIADKDGDEDRVRRFVLTDALETVRDGIRGGDAGARRRRDAVISRYVASEQVGQIALAALAELGGRLGRPPPPAGGAFQAAQNDRRLLAMEIAHLTQPAGASP